MGKNIGIILLLANIFIIIIIMRIFKIDMNMNSLFWISLVNCILYVIEIYIIFGRGKR